jgi:hypothetical protein
MIHESSYWKNDLLKLADRLELRVVQTRWGEKNFYTLEKEIFIGFYSIRKLIEAKKISDSLKIKEYEVREFNYKGQPETIFTKSYENDYEFTKAKTTKVTLLELCNQFIHSHHFLPFSPNGKNVIGFFFCSDHKRTSGLYLITIFDIVDIYRSIGKNYPKSMIVNRLQNGKLHTSVK